jgi:FixJ family two-component response regulator
MLSLIPTVYIVDPDPPVRISLERVIRRAGWAPATFPSAEKFLARPRLPVPGCLMLEVALPDLNGFELLHRIATDETKLPTIVMSGHADIPMTVRAMKAGAVEFLMKPLNDEAVLAAVGPAIARSRALLHQEAELLELRRRYTSLSSRERQVMAEVVAGLLNKQIGAMLGISEITVKAHRGKVMRKMGADSLPALVRMAMRMGHSVGAGNYFESKQYQRPIAATHQFTRLVAV